MPVAIDTSVLIQAERHGHLATWLPATEDGPYYIPAHAAAEFLVGTHPPIRPDLRHRASQIYSKELRHLVSPFTESDAARLALLIAELRSKGEQMGFFDAAIAAGAMARGDTLLAMDADFDRLAERIKLLKP